jgi:WXG100 family type VII secretion target
MAPRYQTDTVSMDEAARHAASVADNLRTRLNSLMNQLEPLLTEWQGDGGAAFQIAREACNEQMNNCHNALTYLSDEVGLSGVTYTTTDVDAGESVNRSSSGLSGISNSLLGARGV